MKLTSSATLLCSSKLEKVYTFEPVYTNMYKMFKRTKKSLIELMKSLNVGML